MANLSREAPEITVYVDGQKKTVYQPLAVQRSIGGHRLDHLSILFPDRGPTFLGLDPADTTEIAIAADFAGKRFVYGWGKVAKMRRYVGPGEEEGVELIARIEPFHFGGPLINYPVWNPHRGEFQAVLGTPIFNPRLDGEIFGSRHSAKGIELGGGLGKMPVFINPESARSDPAKQLQGGSAEEWTLAQAVGWACFWLNDQQYIANPEAAELLKTFDAKRDLLRNLKLREGAYLPEVLDELLEPFNYSWYVEHKSLTERRIRVFRRGKGIKPARPISLQPLRQLSDYRRSSLREAPAINYEAADIINVVAGTGDHVEVEATFELQRAWPKSDDSLAGTPDKLRRDDPDFYTLHENVWRKWVLNEAGDYIGLRPEIKNAYDMFFLVQPFGLTELGHRVGKKNIEQALAVPCRRRFWPCLTQDADGQPIGVVHGCHVEFAIDEDEDGKPRWRECLHECRILEHECGLYFTGERGPEDVWQGGDKARVRITATVRLDARGISVADRRATTRQPDNNALVLDLSKRFHFRRVDKSSIYFDDVKAGTKKAFQINEEQKLRTYCEDIRDAWDFLPIDGTLRLDGLDRVDPAPLELGDSVAGVEGRNFSFNGGTAADPRYPQIAGITYDFQRQTTSLQLDRFQADRRLLTDAQGI